MLQHQASLVTEQHFLCDVLLVGFQIAGSVNHTTYRLPYYHASSQFQAHCGEYRDIVSMLQLNWRQGSKRHLFCVH